MKSQRNLNLAAKLLSQFDFAAAGRYCSVALGFVFYSGEIYTFEISTENYGEIVKSWKKDVWLEQIKKGLEGCVEEGYLAIISVAFEEDSKSYKVKGKVHHIEASNIVKRPYFDRILVYEGRIAKEIILTAKESARIHSVLDAMKLENKISRVRRKSVREGLPRLVLEKREHDNERTVRQCLKEMKEIVKHPRTMDEIQIFTFKRNRGIIEDIMKIQDLSKESKQDFENVKTVFECAMRK